MNTDYKIIGYDEKTIQTLLELKATMEEFNDIRNRYLLELDEIRNKYQSQLICCLNTVQRLTDLK